MRAVVTGGAGFLGSHLCDRLIAEGWDVLALDNLVTGLDSNIGHLHKHPRFRVARADGPDGPGGRTRRARRVARLRPLLIQHRGVVRYLRRPRRLLSQEDAEFHAAGFGHRRWRRVALCSVRFGGPTGRDVIDVNELSLKGAQGVPEVLRRTSVPIPSASSRPFSKVSTLTGWPTGLSVIRSLGLRCRLCAIRWLAARRMDLVLR